MSKREKREGMEVCKAALPLAINWLKQGGHLEDDPPMRYDKLPSVEYGQYILIQWDDYYGNATDVGLVVPFAGQEEMDANLGALVWIESPDNPGGKGATPPIWITLYELSMNEHIVSMSHYKESRR
jgi:hypothetical protein